MEEETLEVCEWTIENFSCWNDEVHGSWFASPRFDLEHVGQLTLYPSYNGQVTVNFWKGKTVPSSGGNMSFIDSDGSLICTKRTHTAGWNYEIRSGLKFEEVASKISKKKDRLIVRLCFLSKVGRSEAVRTTLDLSNVSMCIDPKSIENVESDESKNISIIHYSKKNILDELLLKAVRRGETVEFILELLTKTGKAVSVESQWSLQSNDKKFVRREENKHLFLSCEPWKFSNSLMSELVPNGVTVHLSFKIVNGDIIDEKLNAPSETITAVPKKTLTFFYPFKDLDPLSSENLVEESVAELARDFMGLYQDQDFSDLQLKCGDVTFPVHKNILSTRSPVFKTMLSCNMKEAQSGQVDIGDLDPSTLTLLLAYLYTGVLEEELDHDRALKLYYAADKYQVPSLKKRCNHFFSDSVSIGNVCDLLTLADKCSDDQLTAVSYGFVANHYIEVLQSEEWTNFMESEPKLAMKTVTRLALENYVGKIR